MYYILYSHCIGVKSFRINKQSERIQNHWHFYLLHFSSIFDIKTPITNWFITILKPKYIPQILYSFELQF